MKIEILKIQNGWTVTVINPKNAEPRTKFESTKKDVFARVKHILTQQ